ncbi:hypothetical protein B0H10DRAFT_2216668 [Mycena sp. CBHHK59/15]|nr:hypothetical protein B0H10DRAFT_2240517 [Mycena sp. CBHHK59/15]KAJ6619604.1 hypothetical protein B0H10DRAFT_2216668 [Mycena sp. CBHHK59/15]
MSSRIQNHWDRVLAAPPPSLEGLASDFPGYTFDNSRLPAGLKTRKPRSPPSLPTWRLASLCPTLLPTRTSISWGSRHPITPVINDEVRKAIGRSGAQTTGDGKEKKRGRPKEKENVGGEGDTGTKPKGRFTGEDLIMIARAVIDANPFVAPHGQKGQVWQQVVDALWAQEFRHMTISAASVQHKAEALISYKRDPYGKHKNLSNIIGQGTSTSITINAAKDKSEDAKAKLKKKNDEDREGGHAHSPTSDEDGNTTDRETNTLSTCAFAAHLSLETIDSDDDNATNGKKVSKRRRGMHRSTSSDADGLLGLMKAENAHRAAHDTCVTQSLKTFVSDSREQKKEFTSLLKELVANDRKANLNDA